jgi:hypothetical protein
LQFDGLGVDGEHACAKLYANRQIVDGLEAAVGELEQ